MPRSLSRGVYSAEAVAAQIAADAGTINSRFDLIDRQTFNVKRQLKVSAATVDWDGSRTISRSLTMTMLPDPDLFKAPFRYLVKPWFIVGMPDGGAAEFPMGGYVWTMPQRKVTDKGATGSGTADDPVGAGLTGINPGTWTVTLGDQMHILDAGGVGLPGFIGYETQIITTLIRTALGLANFSDFTGIQDSPAGLPETYVASLWSGAQRFGWVPGQGWTPPSNVEESATTWAQILHYLHRMLGYYPPGFDLDNDRYVARPQVDYSSVAGASIISYTPGPNSILAPEIDSTPNLTDIANRAIVKASNSASSLDVAIADLNTLIPNHPLSQAVIGFYIDRISSSTVTGGSAQLAASAQALLYEAVRSFESVKFTTLANPAHDAWEILNLRVPGDVQFDTPQILAETQWGLDLFTGQMSHDARRVFVDGTS